VISRKKSKSGKLWKKISEKSFGVKKKIPG
jgi:hypothetical protein